MKKTTSLVNISKLDDNRIERIRRLSKEFFNQNNSFSPALIISPFERVGSTWLMDIIDKIGRGQTEPFRQHIGPTSPFCSLNHRYTRLDTKYYHRKLKSKIFPFIWFDNFVASLQQPELQVMKETNLFLTLVGYVTTFHANNATSYWKLIMEQRFPFTRCRTFRGEHEYSRPHWQNHKYR